MNTNKVAPIIEPEEIANVLHVGGARYKGTGWSAFVEPEEERQKVSNESLTLHCTKCRVDTAGIYQKTTDKVRRCPACGSVLIYCPVCHSTVSATEKFAILTCDKCSADFVTNATVEYLASRDRQAREIVLSGIRATGELDLGNYLGAVRQFVEYEAGENLCMYFIADLYTLGTCRGLQKVTIDDISIATDYLAAGLNPERSIIYTQSSVPEIMELAFYLALFQSIKGLESLASFKALAQSSPAASIGNLYGPVLMAADILGPRATVVPIGIDHVSDVEIAINLARKFNEVHGQTFVVPRVSIRSMSGSVPGVLLSDTYEVITDKYLHHGVTDAGKKTRSDRGNPDNCVSVYPVYKILRESDLPALGVVRQECCSGARGCRECKLELSKEIDVRIQPFRERRAELAQRKKYVEEVLHFGGMKAREIIQPMVREVREKLGVSLL